MLKSEAQIHALNAYAALQVEKYPQALKACQKALQLKPDYTLALHLKGLAEFYLGNLKEAEALSKKALDLEPQNAEHHFLLAMVLARETDFAEAEKQFQEALRLKPEDPAFNLDYAGILFHQRKFPLVQSLAQKVLEKDPENRKAKLLLNAARNQEWKTEIDLLSYQPPNPLPEDNPETFVLLGHIYLDFNFQDSALTCFSQALKLNPNLPAAKRGFATVLKLKNSDFYCWMRFYSRLLTIPWLRWLIISLFLAIVLGGILSYSGFKVLSFILLGLGMVYFCFLLYLPWRNLQGVSERAFEQMIVTMGYTPSGESRRKAAEIIPKDQRETFHAQLLSRRQLFKQWSHFSLLTGLGFLALYIITKAVVPAVLGKTGDPILQVTGKLFPLLFFCFFILAFILYWKAKGYEE